MYQLFFSHKNDWNLFASRYFPLMTFWLPSLKLLNTMHCSTKPQKLLTQNSPHANPAIARTTISQKEKSLESQASQIEKLPGRGKELRERIEEQTTSWLGEGHFLTHPKDLATFQRYGHMRMNRYNARGVMVRGT